MPGVVRQAQAPIKKAALGDEGSGEKDDEEDETERSPPYFQGFEDEDEEREGVGPGPEPPRIVPSRYELEPEETPRCTGRSFRVHPTHPSSARQFRVVS